MPEASSGIVANAGAYYDPGWRRRCSGMKVRSGVRWALEGMGAVNTAPARSRALLAAPRGGGGNAQRLAVFRNRAPRDVDALGLEHEVWP